MSTGISVVVPVFNAGGYLDRCIGALLAQDYADEDYEIIVVDNNSTDDSLAIAGQFDRVHLLRERRQGAYSARNTGIRAAKGEIIAFTDPDCVPASNWLSTVADALDVPHRQIVLGKREFESPSRGLRRLGDYDTVLAEHICASNKPEIYFGYANNMAVRRPMLNNGFHAVLRGADTVLVQEVVKSRGCEAVEFVPEMRVVHLEVRSATGFYRKRLFYGVSTERLRSLGTARPLSQRERLGVYRRTVDECGYSAIQATELLALLSLGVLFYSVGRLRGRLS